MFMNKVIKVNIKQHFNPLVSIIIPVYNGEDYIREAIDSALAQTYDNIEIIVVNDGSTDNTEKIVKSYGNKIHYFKKKNGGVATALNLGIRETKGRYVSWLSHDDMYYPNKIEKQVKVLRILPVDERSKYVLYGNYSIINEKSKVVHELKFHLTHEIYKLNIPLYPLVRGLVHGCSLLIPKVLFEQYGYFDKRLKTTQDYDLWYRMFPHIKLVFLHDTLVKSRIHKDQNSQKIPVVYKECDRLWIRMIENLPENQKIIFGNDLLSFYKQTLELMKGANYKGVINYLEKKIIKLQKVKTIPISDIKISVIIPFRNRIKQTTQAISSVQQQTHKNFEIILINDSSTKNIQPIIDITRSDKRILLLSNKKNIGPGASRNRGIEVSSGEYVAFLDNDDFFLPEKIDIQLKCMFKNKFLFSHTSYETIDTNNVHSRLAHSGKYKLTFPKLIAHCPIATPTVMVHKSLLSNNRFPTDFAPGEDVCFWIKLASRSKILGIDRALTRIRERRYSSRQSSKKGIDGINKILMYVKNNFPVYISQIKLLEESKKYIY